MHIEIDSFALSPTEAEQELVRLLSTYGQTITTEVRSGASSIVVSDGKGGQTTTTFVELLTELHLAGTCELDRVRWRDTDPYGSVAFVVPEGMPPFVIGTGPRTSPPLEGPGYATNDVVTELLDDVLHFRKEAANLSDKADMYRAAFRAYRSYLTASISAIDAFVNRLSFFARNYPPAPLSDPDVKLLSRKVMPLDEKLRQWLPIVSAGKTVSETGAAWTDYQAIRTARNALVHVNEPEFVFAIRPAVDVLNLCRRGVGGLLTEVGNLLGRNPAQAVLRVARAPRAHFVPEQ